MKIIKCDICGYDITNDTATGHIGGKHIVKGLLGEMLKEGHIDICDYCWHKIREERKKEMHENN